MCGLTKFATSAKLAILRSSSSNGVLGIRNDRQYKGRIWEVMPMGKIKILATNSWF